MGTRGGMRGPRPGRPAPLRRTRILALVAAACLGLGVGVVAGPGSLARLGAPRVTLQRVAVRGHAQLAPQEVVSAAGLRPGIPLDPPALRRARQRLRAHPWIVDARVVALPPSQLLVAIEERRPVARALLAAGPTFVDASGVPFAAADAAAPGPLLVGVEEAERARPHPVLSQGLDLLAALEAHGLPPAHRVILGGAPPETLPAFELAPEGPRILLGSGELDVKLARLARLRAARLPEVQRASEIDLRFGADVVLRSDPAPGGSGVARTRGGAASPRPDAPASTGVRQREG